MIVSALQASLQLPFLTTSYMCVCVPLSQSSPCCPYIHEYKGMHWNMEKLPLAIS